MKMRSAGHFSVAPASTLSPALLPPASTIALAAPLALAAALALTPVACLRPQRPPAPLQGWREKRLEREAGRQVISDESIYRFIDGQLRRPKNTGGAQSPLSTHYRKLQWTVDAETRTL